MKDVSGSGREYEEGEGQFPNLARVSLPFFVHNLANEYIDGVRPVEKRHGWFFPRPEQLHFLLEFAVVLVVVQPLEKGLNRFLLLARGKVCPAEIEIE